MSNLRAISHREPGPGLRQVRAVTGSNVPVPLTSFVGRDAELQVILSMLDGDGTRLLTITGPGGVGKTRLALETARRVEPDFDDGVRYLTFTAEQRPEQVLPSVARAVVVNERGDRPLFDSLVDTLSDRHLLLVLDNFEHLLADSPAWLVSLLERCPRIKALVTSRVPLNVTGERRFLVPPMPVPDEAELGDPGSYASVDLFFQRARAIRSTFDPSPETSARVVEICRRLDGLPLAIELAAARSGAMSTGDILARLNDETLLLEGGHVDAPSRLRSLSGAIAWGYDLLDSDARRAFMQVSVFPGEFTQQAARAVIQVDSVDPATAFTSLVDASLVQVTHGNGAQSRYRMLGTIREFAHARLVDSGEERAVRDRHADWCLAVIADAPPVDPVRDTAWFDFLEDERVNLVAALRWLDEADRLDDLARLLIDTRWLWYPSGRQAEGLAWFQRLLERHPRMEAITRSDALCWAGHLAQMLERPDATAYLEQALALARDIDDSRRQAVVTLMLAIMAEDRGDYGASKPLLQSARTLYGRDNIEWAQITVDYHLGIVEYGSGRLASAAKMLDAARIAAEAYGEKLVPVWTRNFLALTACEQGNPQAAVAALADQPVDLAAGHRHDLSVFLGTVGVIATSLGRYDVAARLFGALARTADTVMFPERAAFERAASMARRELGEDAWRSQFETGRHLRRAEIEAEIERLLQSKSGGGAAVQHQRKGPGDSLTRRELEVLKLLADGHTNQEIADALFLSQRTVANHIDHILTKLDVRSRTAAVAYAIRNGLA